MKEKQGSDKLRQYMEAHGWLTIKLHGGMYQSGLPDILAFHPVHGIRFIETKTEKGKLSSRQTRLFSRITEYGGQIYVLRDEKDYNDLFRKPNWLSYVRGLG